MLMPIKTFIWLEEIPVVGIKIHCSLITLLKLGLASLHQNASLSPAEHKCNFCSCSLRSLVAVFSLPGHGSSQATSSKLHHSADKGTSAKYRTSITNAEVTHILCASGGLETRAVPVTTRTV